MSTVLTAGCYYSGNTLQQVKDFKYLTVVFTSNGRLNKEIDTRIGKTSGVLCKLAQFIVPKRKPFATIPYLPLVFETSSDHVNVSLKKGWRGEFRWPYLLDHAPEAYKGTGCMIVSPNLLGRALLWSLAQSEVGDQRSTFL